MNKVVDSPKKLKTVRDVNLEIENLGRLCREIDALFKKDEYPVLIRSEIGASITKMKEKALDEITRLSLLEIK
jgi:hypothetical protein